MTSTPKKLRGLAAGATLLCTSAVTAYADNVILDDLIVDGSACIGQDCVNGESFGFDTIRIKENNLRIKAQDLKFCQLPDKRLAVDVQRQHQRWRKQVLHR